MFRDACSYCGRGPRRFTITVRRTIAHVCSDACAKAFRRFAVETYR